MIKNYYKPTPKRWRKVGDALLTLSISFAGLSILDEFRWVGITVAVLGGIGKFLTNLFPPDESATN